MADRAANTRQQRIIPFNLNVTSLYCKISYTPVGKKSKRGYFDNDAKLYQGGIKVTAKNIKSPRENCLPANYTLRKKTEANQELLCVTQEKH